MKNKTIKGSFLVATSALFFATYGVWAKLMQGVFGEFNQAWIRAALTLLILIPWGLMTCKFKPIRLKDLKWFAVVSLSGALNQAPYFYGFKHLTVGTATLLFYTMLTVGAYVIGKFFFNESITRVKLVSLAIAIIGISFIYRFTLTPSQLLPAIATVAAGLMGAAIVVFSKKLTGRYSETQALTSLFIAMFFSNYFIGSVVGETVPVMDISTPWLAEFGYGLSIILSNAAVFAGFKYLEPSIGGLIGLLEIVFAVILGVVLFGETISLGFMIGSSFIIAAMMLPHFIAIRQPNDG